MFSPAQAPLSASELSEATLKRTLDADQQVLGYYLSTSEALADPAVLSHVYREIVSGVGQQLSSTATALPSWLPPLQHERNWVKQQKLGMKLSDTSSLLRILPQHTAARQRLLKCFQRASHFLVNQVDPHAHLMHQRAALLQRYLLAYERMSKREEIAAIMGNVPEVDANGNLVSASSRVEEKPNESFQDKVDFIEHLFARSLEEYERDPNSSVRHTTFVTKDEFVGQLLSFIPENLPSQPTLEEELEMMEQPPTSDESTNKTTLPVSLFGLTGLMGLPFQAPSALRAKSEELAADLNELVPDVGEDDASFAARLHSFTEAKRAERKKKQDKINQLKKKKREERELKSKEKEAKEKQNKLRRQDSNAVAVAALEAEALAAIDPDATLPPEAHFCSMQMLELVLDESKSMTLNLIETATKEYEAFKVKSETTAAASTSTTPATEAEKKTDTTETPALAAELTDSDSSSSIYPLTPFPVTHLLHFLFRDLMRKSLLCTHHQQRTVRQLNYIIKRIIQASQELLEASTELIKQTNEAKWSEFEKQIKYETIGAGSLQALFADCLPPVPNAPSVTSSGSSSSASTPSPSTPSNLPPPLTQHASPHAPLISTILSTSLLTHIALPTLSYIWSLLFKSSVFDRINEPQAVIRGTMENPIRDEESDEKSEEKKEEDSKKKEEDGPTFNLFTHLVTFLNQLDEVNQLLPVTSNEEQLFKTVSDTPMTNSAANHLSVVVETPHTYFSDSEDQQVVYIPNASYLVVEFDPRCSSEKGRDHLTITVPVDDANSRLGLSLPQPPQKVAGPYHGNRDNWPKMPIIIQNTNTLVFTFHSDAANNASTYFGYRAIVTGYSHLHELVPPTVGSGETEIQSANKTVYSSAVQSLGPRGARPPKPTLSSSRPWYFLFDLQHTVAHVIGRVLRKEMIGTASQPTATITAATSSQATEAATAKPLDDEQILARYLNSPLFYNADLVDGETKTDEEDESDETEVESVPSARAIENRRHRAEEHAFETRFLQDFVESKPGSVGLQLDTLFKKQLQSKRVDALGGPITKKVVRLFIAVLLKHLGLTKLAAYYLVHKGIKVEGVELPTQTETTKKQPDPTIEKVSSIFAQVSQPASTLPATEFIGTVIPDNDSDWTTLGEELLEVWRRGQTMHQYIVSGKQLAQQALDNLIAEEDAKLKQTTATATTTPATGAVATSPTPAASSSSTSAPSPPAPSPSPQPTATEVERAQAARAQAEKLATYEGYTENMLDKCTYLLTLPSFAHHPLSNFAQLSAQIQSELSAPSLDMATESLEIVQLTRGVLQDQGGSRRSKFESLKSLINLYHSSAHWKQFKEAQPKIAFHQRTQQYVQSLADLISTFLRDEIPLATIRRIREKQAKRAIRRAAAMDQFLALLKSLRLRSTRVSLMKTFGPPFRSYVSYGMGSEDEMGNLVGGHYLNHIEAAGRKYRRKVQQAFYQLYGYFIEQLKSDSDQTSIALKSLILDAFCIDWHADARENNWLIQQQLLSLLDEIIKPNRSAVVGDELANQTQADLTPFQLLAENLFKFLSVNCMNPQMRRTQTIKSKSRTKEGKQDEQEEKSIVPVNRPEHKEGDEKEEDRSSTSPSPPPPTSTTVVDPFAFLATSASFNTLPLDSFQRSVLDRLVASLQHSASLLSSLRKSGGASIIDSEILDIALTPEQKHLLYRRKNRPSASAAVSSSSAQERQAQMAGILASGDEDGGNLDEDELDIEYGDAHPSFPLIRRYIELEQQSYDSLALLASISSDAHHRSYLEYLCSPPVLRTFLLVFVSGSPRMQSIGIRTLAKVLPLVTAFQLRDQALYDYLIKIDKDERLGQAKKLDNVPSTPSNASASNTPFSSALKQSYEPQGSLDCFDLGDSMPQPQSLALSRSSSLQARLETDAVLDSQGNEDKLDQIEGGKFIAFLFKKLSELLLATTTMEQSSDPSSLRPTTPLGGSILGSLAQSSSASNLSGMRSKHLNPLEFRDGQMKLVLASELITLIRTLHKQTNVPVATETVGATQTIINHDWSNSIQSFLTSHLLTLSKLVSPHEPCIASSQVKNEVGLTLACLAVIGGHTEVLRVGGLVQTTKKSKEQGILISMDRIGNRCKVLFQHATNKVIDCDLSKLIAIDTIPPDSALVTLNTALLNAFQIFTRALDQEENERLRVEEELMKKKKEKQEKLELEKLQKQFAAEETQLLDPFGGFRDELADKWACPACTYENPIVKPSCEICGQENPSYFIKKQVVEEEVDLDDEMNQQLLASRITLTNEHLLYYQLRSKALKALCVLLQHPKSMLLLFESRTSNITHSMMPSLVSMAIRPTHLDVFKSIDTLEDVENRLFELMSESSIGLIQDQLRFNRKSQGADLKFSPFKNLQLHLPSNLDVGSARAISFVGDRESLCEVKYNGSGGNLSVGLIRANFLVPNSLPVYYFEVTIHSLGSPAIPSSSGGLSTPRSGSSSPSLTPQLVRKSSPVLRALASPLRSGLPASPTLGSSSSGTNTSGPITSSAFDLAVGLFRCGMPFEGCMPGRHSTYAYSGRNGELHLTRSKQVVREKIFPSFKAGDTIGCGVQSKHGQRMIFFTRNGKLLKAQSLEDDFGLDELDLGPTAIASSRPSTARRNNTSLAITSDSGIDANLSGRFYPAIWLENPGCHISTNFGQQQFKYDFTQLLPPDYRQKLAAMEKAAEQNGGKKLSAVELKRRTMAEDLCEMMGNFPIDLCVLALERNHDDKAAAGDWLFTNGAKALQQMAADALRSQAELRNGRAGGREDDGESSGEEEDLADFLVGGDVHAAGGAGGRADRNRENVQNFLDDEVDVDIPLGLDPALVPRQQQQRGGGGGRGNSELDLQRERARQLLSRGGGRGVGEDELESVLSQIIGGGAGSGAGQEDELSATTEPIIYENLKLDEIEAGQSLVVASSAVRLTANQHTWMAYFAGRTGVVTGININAALVTLIFQDTASGIKRCASFPVTVLQKPQRMWLDPCRDLYERNQEKSEKKKDEEKEKVISWQELAHEFVSIEKALSVQKVRRAVLRCIATWPRSIQFDVQHLNGPTELVALLKLTAAQFLSSSTKRQGNSGEIESTDGSKINLLESFKLKLIQLVSAENQVLLANAQAEQRVISIAPPLRITEKVYGLTDKSSSSKSEDGKSESKPHTSASSVKSSTSSLSSAPRGGYSSASANESELSEDDAASNISSRRQPFSGRAVDELVDEENDEADSLAASDVAHEPYEDDEEHEDDGAYDDEEDHDIEYDEDEHDDGSGDGGQFIGLDPEQSRLMDLADFLRRDPSGAQAAILNHRGGGLLNILGGRGPQSYLGRSAAAPPMLRARKKKSKKEEQKSNEQHASLDEKLQQLLQQPRSAFNFGLSSNTISDQLVTPLLIEECIVHLIQSINHGPPLRTIRSAHPYPSHTEKRGKVHIGGASKLLVRFDPRCQIGTDLMTRLSFYRDSQYQDLILSVQGSGPPPENCFPPFIVDSDRLYYKFTSGTNSRAWGFKFKVEPVDLRMDDKAALLGRNFELSGWLLDLFISHFPNLFQYAYITELYNAVVWYVIHSRPSTKSRGVEILVRLLFHLRSLLQKEQAERGHTNTSAVPTESAAQKGSVLTKLADLKLAPSSESSLVPSAVRPTSFTYTLAQLPDFGKLHPLAQQMDTVLESMGLSNAPPLHGYGGGRQMNLSRSLQSPTMQGLVELLSTVDLLSNEFDLYQQSKQKSDESTELVVKKPVEKLSFRDTTVLGLTPPTADNFIDLIEQFHDRLRIDKALLFFHTPSNDKTNTRTPKDITADMVKYLGWSNNVQLFIPTDPKELAIMPGFENEISASTLSGSSSSSASSGSSGKKIGFHKMEITYSILTPTYNSASQQLDMKVSKQLKKSISLLSSSKPTLIKPQASRFENVVNMSRLTLEMKNATKTSTVNGVTVATPPRLPPEFLLESYRNYFIQKNFLQLVGEKIHDHTPGQPRINKPSPSTGVHNGTRSFTLSFWIYLNSGTVPPAKDAHFRYIFHTGNMPDQNSANLNRGMIWPTTGFSVGLGPKDQMIHTVFYDPSGSNPIHSHSRSIIQPKRWTFITVIVTDGIDLNLYIDGSIEITQKFPLPLPALSTDPFYVGTLPSGMLKLYRNQSRVPSAESPFVEDPYRVGLGFSGALKDMRFYSYDVDPSTYVPASQLAAKKFEKERSNKNNFHVPVEQPILATRKELQEVIGGTSTSSSAKSSFSLTASSSSSSSGSSASNINWTPSMDIQVMEVFQNIVQSIRNKRPQEQPEEDEDEPRPIRESFVHLLDLSLSSKAVVAAFKDPKLLQSANLLTHIPHDVLKQRFATIQLLNAKLIDVLPFVDFTQSLNPWSLAHRLSNISWLILMEVKTKAWKSILTSTASGQSVNITINRPRALKARERGNDPDGLKSVFGQTFQQLHFLRPAQLRIQQGNRPFRVKFAGEGGIDAGGLFRDAVSEVCSTLLSRDTPLFIPCPNAAGFGDYSNTWIPNPKSNSSLHLSMYAFVGKFMGMAIRGGHVLNLDFPPVIWKGIVSMPITRDDIQDMNALGFKVLEQFTQPSLTKEQFDELPQQKFVTLTSDGREIELKENSANLVVTYENRAEYVKLEEHYRLHEFDLAIDMMKKGLGAIVPVHLLSLFTPSEVETMVCGAREVNIEFLKRHTEYQRGIRPTDSHVRFFWSVLEEMSQKERQLFIRFVSGQSRLWSDDASFIMKFKLMPSAIDNDVILPVSHTCFFSLELPKYSTQAIMRAKLLYSINNCYMIDADTAADNLDWNEE